MKARGDLRRLLPGSNPEPMIARPPVSRDRKLPPQVLCQPVLQATIGTVAPHQLNGRKQVLSAAQEELGTPSVMKVSFMNVRLQESALCVDQNMALAAPHPEPVEG